MPKPSSTPFDLLSRNRKRKPWTGHPPQPDIGEAAPMDSSKSTTSQNTSPPQSDGEVDVLRQKLSRVEDRLGKIDEECQNQLTLIDRLQRTNERLEIVTADISDMAIEFRDAVSALLETSNAEEDATTLFDFLIDWQSHFEIVLQRGLEVGPDSHSAPSNNSPGKV